MAADSLKQLLRKPNNSIEIWVDKRFVQITNEVSSRCIQFPGAQYSYVSAKATSIQNFA